MLGEVWSIVLIVSLASIDLPHVGAIVPVARWTLQNTPATGSHGHQSQPEADNEMLRTQSPGRNVLEGATITVIENRSGGNKYQDSESCTKDKA